MSEAVLIALIGLAGIAIGAISTSVTLLVTRQQTAERTAEKTAEKVIRVAAEQAKVVLAEAVQEALRMASAGEAGDRR